MLSEKKENSLYVLGVYTSLFFGMVVAGKFTIPFWPVSFTLQTLYLGLMQIFAPKYARSVMFIWFGSGIIGAPVFSAGGGWNYLAHGYGTGYIIGMMLSTLLLCTPVTRLWRLMPEDLRAMPSEATTHDTHTLSEIMPAKASYLVNLAIIYGCGFVYLSALNLPLRGYNYLIAEIVKLILFKGLYKLYVRYIESESHL